MPNTNYVQAVGFGPRLSKKRSAIQAILARHFRRVLVMEHLKVEISISCGANGSAL
ncbi:MAG: hypothetical protein WAK17_06100 [Candidatus Nitrosopolaris sp.]